MSQSIVRTHPPPLSPPFPITHEVMGGSVYLLCIHHQPILYMVCL